MCEASFLSKVQVHRTAGEALLLWCVFGKRSQGAIEETATNKEKTNRVCFQCSKCFTKGCSAAAPGLLGILTGPEARNTLDLPGVDSRDVCDHDLGEPGMGKREKWARS